MGDLHGLLLHYCSCRHDVLARNTPSRGACEIQMERLESIFIHQASSRGPAGARVGRWIKVAKRTRSNYSRHAHGAYKFICAADSVSDATTCTGPRNERANGALHNISLRRTAYSTNARLESAAASALRLLQRALFDPGIDMRWLATPSRRRAQLTFRWTGKYCTSPAPRSWALTMRIYGSVACGDAREARHCGGTLGLGLLRPPPCWRVF
eukprot:SAG11_NODE_1804_length_4234_cov_20.948730_2_plen_211_part_00